MKRILFLLLPVFMLTSCAELQQFVNTAMSEPTNAEISDGLKEALNIGISKGADQLSAKDGYFKSAYKILLPQEARKITDKLQGIPGFSNVEDVILEKINRGAEDAATKAKPIFIKAIKSMTISDVVNILMGSDDAATQYLKNATSSELFSEFHPVIVNSLNKFNAIEYWDKAIGAYNSIPLVKHVDTKLDHYVTNQALDGLFKMVANEEKEIRRNPVKRVSELLRKVFAKQDSNRK